MTTSKKWLCISSLITAGMLSVALSLLGLFTVLWTGLPKNAQEYPILGLFLPLIAAFPLLALAVGVTRYASRALWISAFISWTAYAWVVRSDFHGSLLDFLTLSVTSRSVMIPMALLLLATLVEFGTQFYEFTYGSQWVRWKEARHEYDS